MIYFLAEGGTTCLMKASSIREGKLVDSLLRHHANVNAADQLDRSAVHYAFNRHIPFDGGYQGGYGYQGDYGYPSERDADEGRLYSEQNFCLNFLNVFWVKTVINMAGYTTSLIFFTYVDTFYQFE